MFCAIDGEQLIGIAVSSSRSKTPGIAEETDQDIEAPPTVSSPTLLLPKAILKQYCHCSRDVCCLEVLCLMCIGIDPSYLVLSFLFMYSSSGLSTDVFS